MQLFSSSITYLCVFVHNNLHATIMSAYALSLLREKRSVDFFSP